MTDTEKRIKNSFSGKGVFPPKYAFTLLIPLRNLFLSPKKLIQRLGLEENHHVLEIGPGPGYFSLPVSRALRSGSLVLLDIQQAMLGLAQKRLQKRNVSNVRYVLCNGDEISLESDSFERVFMVTVIGEIENKNQYLKEIHRLLKADGVLSISELAGDPDKLSQEELEVLVCANGFKAIQCFGNKRNYTLNFKKNDI